MSINTCLWGSFLMLKRGFEYKKICLVENKDGFQVQIRLQMFLFQKRTTL